MLFMIFQYGWELVSKQYWNSYWPAENHKDERVGHNCDGDQGRHDVSIDGGHHVQGTQPVASIHLVKEKLDHGKETK